MLYPALINQRIKKFFCFHLIILIAFLFSACGGSGGDDNPFTWTDPLMPEISVRAALDNTEIFSGESLYNFNNVSPGGEKSVEFIVGNSGVGDLVIHEIFFLDNTSSFLLDNSDLPPIIGSGDTASFTVTFAPASMGENFSNTLYIINSDPEDEGGFYFNVTGDCINTIEDMAWNKKIDGNAGDDSASAVAVDSQGDVYVAGYGTNIVGSSSGMDWWIRKFNANGVEYESSSGWNKKINIHGTEEISAIAVDSNDNVYVLGYSYGGSADAVIIRKYAPNGTEDTGWSREISDPDGSGTFIYNYSMDIAVDQNDNVFITGFTGDGSDSTWWLKKFSSAGIEENLSVNTAVNSEALTVTRATAVCTFQNSLYVAGYGKKDDGTIRWWIKKLNSNGTDNTCRVFGAGYNDINSNEDRSFDIAVDSAGNVFLAGTAAGNWWIRKFDADLNDDASSWEKIITNDGDDAALSIATGADDSLYAAGYGMNLVGGDSLSDWWVKKYSSAGVEDATDWNFSFDGTFSNDAARAICTVPGEDNETIVYAAGYGTNLVSNSGSVSGKDWWIKKFVQ